MKEFDEERGEKQRAFRSHVRKREQACLTVSPSSDKRQAIIRKTVSKVAFGPSVDTFLQNNKRLFP
jgi:hypothetical protein